MKKWLFRVLGILFGLILVSIVTLHVHSLLQNRRLDQAFEGSPIESVDFVELDGLSVAYRRAGTTNAPTLVFVHGFLGSSFDFRLLFDAFADDFDLVAIDMIGFGHSDKPDTFPYTADAHAEVIVEVLEVLNIDSFHLVGHSMGARVALYMSHARPDAVVSLTLLAPAGVDRESEGRALPRWFYTIVFRNYALQRLGFQSAVAGNVDRDVFDALYYFSRTIPAETLQAMGQAQETIDWDEIIEGIEQPTLIIVGAEDSWTPPSISESYVTRIQEASLHIVDDVGHLPMLEDAASVVEIMNAFLDD